MPFQAILVEKEKGTLAFLEKREPQFKGK